MPQLELGASATSVIPTTTAAATRAADVAVMTETNFSSWYNQTEGTFVVEFIPTQKSTLFRVISGNASNYPQLYYTGSALAWQASVDGGAIGPDVTANIPVKAALAYAANNLQSAFDGILGAQDTTVTLNAPTSITLGAAGVTANRELNGTIKSIRYYATRLTNAQLQSLSA
jgi:hypothetical protein